MNLDRKLKAHLADERHNGRHLDETFIAAGFVGVEAEINLLDAAFGIDGYRAFLAATCSERGRDAFRRREDAIRDRFLSARNLPGGLDAVIDELISDPVIPGQAKYGILRRFAPQCAAQRLTPWVAAYQASISKEISLICKMHREPCISLLERSTQKTRKSICNDICLDAFNAFGFQAKKKIRGLVSLEKRLDPGNTICIEVDHHAIENARYPSDSTDITQYWRKIPLDLKMTLIHRSGRASAIEIPLGISMNAIAVTRMMQFDCSCSLEVAIRAHAFLYQSIFLPFERIATDHASPH